MGDPTNLEHENPGSQRTAADILMAAILISVAANF